MSLFKSSKIIGILLIVLFLLFFICPTPNIYEAYQSLKDKKAKEKKDKEKKRAELVKKEKQSDWGIDYHGSVKFDNYYVPQINFSPAYIFFDSDYYTY